MQKDYQIDVSDCLQVGWTVWVISKLLKYVATPVQLCEHSSSLLVWHGRRGYAALGVFKLSEDREK